MKQYRKAFVRQIEQRDCGLACLLSVVRYHGGSSNFESLRRLSGTSVTGTTLLGLFQAAQLVGFDALGCEASLTDLLQLKNPCILHVELDAGYQHYVVFFGKKKGAGQDMFIIGDPSEGVLTLTSAELQKIWKSKAALILEPSSRFKKKSEISHEKYRWFKSLIRKDISLLVTAALIGVCIAMLGLAMVVFLQRVVDEFIPKRNFQKLLIGTSLVLFLLIVKETLSIIRSELLFKQSRNFSLRIASDFFNRLLYLPQSFFDTRKIGELTARIHDTSRIQRIVSQIAGNAILDSIIVVVSLIFIFSYSRVSALLLFLLLPLFFFAIYLNNKRIGRAQKATMINFATAESNYISTLQGIDAIKNYKKEQLFSKINRQIYSSYQTANFQMGQIQARIYGGANIFAAILLCILLVYLSNLVLNNQLKVGELMAVMGTVGPLLSAVANLALLSIPINEARIAYDRLYEFASIEGNNNADALVEDVESLSINNLSFRYPGRKSLFSDVSFSVNKGELVALMGENGSGKSTLVQILMQNYNAESGEIIVNKTHRLSEIQDSNWKSIAAVVPQHVHIFNGNILENIAFEDAASDPQKVVDFLSDNGFLTFFNVLPQSLMTLVGEEGINLSGGQKQLIALARALYHQPKLMILDEMTAAMDRESELFALNLLQKLKFEMAIIMITHRLHVLKAFSDTIYIVENGTISNYGNHKSLLESQNLYSRYWLDLAK